MTQVSVNSTLFVCMYKLNYQQCKVCRCLLAWLLYTGGLFIFWFLLSEILNYNIPLPLKHEDDLQFLGMIQVWSYLCI